MPSAIEMSHLFMQANAALVETLVKALQGVRHAPTPTVSLPRFFGRPESPGDPTIDEWLYDFDVFVRQCGVPAGEPAVVLVDYLGGCAKEEVLCHPCEVRRDFGELVSLLRRVFGPREIVTSLYAEFYSRVQSVGETLAEFSRALIRLHQRIESAAPTVAERQALAVLGDGALKHQFVVGVRDEWVRRELRRLVLRSADRPFIVVRGEALCLMCDEEARVVQMRPVEKAAPALSGPVDGSVLGLDAVVLDDGGDVSVSRGGDMDLCGVDTLVSATVSGSLCDIDRVTGGVDTLVSATVDGCLCDIDSVSGDVDTALSGAVSSGLCDLDRVSRGDLVERVGDISLSRGGDAIKSGVDEYVCGVSSIMTADGLDVCGRDSVVSDETGEVVSVDSVDDVVACGDDPLLPDAVRVVDRLSVVGDTLVCGAGVARSDRGDTDAVVGSGVAQRGWVDRLMFADDSLRPSHHRTQCVCVVVYWQLPDIYRDMAIASASNTVCTDDSWATHADTYLHCTVYFIFILCILSPGRLIKKVGRDVMDREFVYICSYFFIIYGTYFIARRR